MSNTHIPRTFLKNVLQNGVGRHVCQLQRLTLKFCKSYAGSRGMRDFIETDLIEFTRSNPGVVVYLQPRRHRAAMLCAEYLNGGEATCPVNNFPREEICQWVEHLRTRSGHQIIRFDKLWHTDNPSIQGIWTPFLNKDPELNVTEFPCEELSRLVPEELSASERLLEMAKQLRAGNVVEIPEKDDEDCVVQVAKSSS